MDVSDAHDFMSDVQQTKKGGVGVGGGSVSSETLPSRCNVDGRAGWDLEKGRNTSGWIRDVEAESRQEPLWQGK